MSELKLDYENARGDTLALSYNQNFHISNIDGMTSMSSNISSSIIGGIDGDTVNNIQAQPRSIILDLTVNNNADVEDTKRHILNVIKAKQKCALVWEQNDRIVKIEGIVEAIEMPRWVQGVTMQVTIHCEKPFWEDIDFVLKQISDAIDLHYFTESPYDMLYFPIEGIPFGEYDSIRTKTFHNAGDVAVGLEITIVALSTVTNPIIYDVDGNFFGVGYGTGEKRLVMEMGDNIVITTTKGKKTVTLNGVNIFDKIKPNSTWLQLEAGDNQFTINSDDEATNNMRFNLSYKQQYI